MILQTITLPSGRVKELVDINDFNHHKYDVLTCPKCGAACRPRTQSDGYESKASKSGRVSKQKPGFEHITVKGNPQALACPDANVNGGNVETVWGLVKRLV